MQTMCQLNTSHGFVFLSFVHLFMWKNSHFFIIFVRYLTHNCQILWKSGLSMATANLLPKDRHVKFAHLYLCIVFCSYAILFSLEKNICFQISVFINFVVLCYQYSYYLLASITDKVSATYYFIITLIILMLYCNDCPFV